VQSTHVNKDRRSFLKDLRLAARSRWPALSAGSRAHRAIRLHARSEPVIRGTVCSNASTYGSVGALGRQRPGATRSDARTSAKLSTPAHFLKTVGFGVLQKTDELLTYAVLGGHSASHLSWQSALSWATIQTDVRNRHFVNSAAVEIPSLAPRATIAMPIPILKLRENLPGK
jgi:hypothetical protein